MNNRLVSYLNKTKRNVSRIFAINEFILLNIKFINYN